MFRRHVLASVLVLPAFALSTLVPRALAAEYHEAPSLAALVAQHQLPPVEQRVPEQPDVVKPTASIGRYGGELRTAFRGDSDQNAILRIVGNQGLTRWTPDYEDVVPNVAAGWTRSDDASVYTFKLRPGMKWSDGTPFTADDITFFVNDLLPDPQFFSSPPSQYVINGKPMRAEKVDDTTVKLIFAGPYLTLPRVLATPLGQHPVLYEKHYCEQFVPKYNPNLPALLKQTGQPDWPTLFRLKCGDIEIPSRWSNVDRPTLDPWIISTPYSGNATQVVLKRNPYFWETDTAGNQLPYIDTVNMHVISDVQSIVLAAVGGQLDLQVRHINTINNKPVLAQHADQAGYVLEPLTATDANAEALFINQTDTNAKLRGLLTNHDFREALSLAIDRDEINDIVFLDQSKPWQVAPLQTDKFYNQQLATQYTDLDLTQANKILDGLGLSKRDGDGFRLYPDGSRVFMTADAMVLDPASIDVLQLVKKDWAAIGIDMGINTEERSLFYNRGHNNDYDIDVMPIPGGIDATSDPRGWLSTHTLDSRQSLPWVNWYQSGGKLGERPSDSMVKRLQLWDQWKQATSDAQADGLFKQILQMAADAFEVIGTEQGLTTFGIHSKKLMNVPASMPNSWSYATPAPSLPQQYYFAQ
jgi:peptide/nickel transport system substrate-binding protein